MKQPNVSKTKEFEQVSRKDRERERHCREILEAAERIFANKGYHATTIEAIAKEAQFAVGTLYNLFKGKDDLYSRVIETCAQDFMDRFEKNVLSIENPADAIAALIELRLTHFHEHREFIRIAFEANPGSRLDPVRLLPPRLVATHDRYIEEVTMLFKRGIERGIFDEADPLYLTLCLEGTMNAFVSYWSRRSPGNFWAEGITKIKREFLERIKLRLNGTSRPAAAS